MNRENSSNIIRLLAGGWLLYLSYDIFKSLRAGNIENKILFIVAVVLFVAAGAVFVFWGIQGMIKQGQSSTEEQADENLNEDLESEEEIYDIDLEARLTTGKMKSIEQELAKLKDVEEKDILADSAVKAEETSNPE